MRGGSISIEEDRGCRGSRLSMRVNPLIIIIIDNPPRVVYARPSFVRYNRTSSIAHVRDWSTDRSTSRGTEGFLVSSLAFGAFKTPVSQRMISEELETNLDSKWINKKLKTSADDEIRCVIPNDKIAGIRRPWSSSGFLLSRTRWFSKESARWNRLALICMSK